MFGHTTRADAAGSAVELRQIAHCAARRRGGQRGIVIGSACDTSRWRFAGFQARSPRARIDSRRSVRPSSLSATRIERFGMSISMVSPLRPGRYCRPGSLAGGTMPDRQTGGAAGEAAVGDQCAGLASPLDFR